MRHNLSPEVSTKVPNSTNFADCRWTAHRFAHAQASSHDLVQRHQSLLRTIAVVSAFLLVGIVGCGKSEPPAVKPEDVAVTMPGSTATSDAIEAPLTPPKIDMPPAMASEKDDVASKPAATNVETPDAATEIAAGEQVDGPEDHLKWPVPQLAIVLTGNQYGYIEPCGCTGLENQKGGLARRMTFMKQLSEMGWEVLPVDAGNQVRRFGRQAEIKFQTTAGGLEEIGYRAVGFGPDDLRLGVGELVAAVAAADDPQDGLFVSSNVTLIDPSLTAQYKVIDQGGRKVGVTSALDPASLKAQAGGEIEVGAVAEGIKTSLASINDAGADFRILLFYGEEEAAAEAVRTVPGFDLVIVAGGYGEPLYRPQTIEGTETKMIVTGNKGMYAGVVALYEDQPYRYARVAMTHDFEDAPEMRRLMATYQNQLEAIGLMGLGLKPIEHPSGDRFVGTKVCGQCHTTALAIWEGTPHAHATDSIVKPNERGDVPRHFDPECISCHVTGWNAQNYYPYESGYLSLAESSHLMGNGCENCHGPGAKHSAAEREGSGVANEQRDMLRMAMRLPLEKAKDTCLQCHDLDNSPDFHKDGAFDDYWAEVEHYGLD